MYGRESGVLLRHYLEQSLTKSAIAAELGLHGRTIERWVAAGDLDRDLDAPLRYRPRPPVPTMLDGVNAGLRGWVARASSTP